MSKRIGFAYESEDLQTYSRLVDAGAVGTIDRGTPTKQGSTGYAGIMADGEGTTSERFTGIAKSVSSETAAADGRVELFLPVPGLVYAGSPKTDGAANTQAKIDALAGKRVIFDLTSTDWTIDTAASDAVGNVVVIIGGDYRDDKVYFCVSHTVINSWEDN